MNSSHISDDEMLYLGLAIPNPSTPLVIAGVSKSQFSIALYYGGCMLNGHEYTYFPDTDELIRKDVLKELEAYRRKIKQATKKATSQQGSLFPN